MRSTFIGHASILVEVNGVRVLSDPWWEGPCFGTQWWVYPPTKADILKNVELDYIYISHGHHDHLHLGTLRRLRQGAVILVSDELDIGEGLKAQGFDVREISRNQEVDLGNDVFCRIIRTYGDDTLMCISDGSQVLVNLNDALHASPPSTQESICQFLNSIYEKIDYAFCGYGIASHFPCCYVVPGMNRWQTAAGRQSHFNRQWANIMAKIEPAYAFPFAADVILLEEDMIWANEPTHNAQRPTDLFNSLYADLNTKAIDIAPGFVIEDGDVKNNVCFKPLEIDAIKRDYAVEYKVANREAKYPEGGVAALIELIRKNIVTSAQYFKECEVDYNFLIDLKGIDDAIAVRKKGDDILVEQVSRNSVDVKTFNIVLKVRYSYLRRSLTHAYGDEVMYVGSGCLIEYMDADDIGTGLHHELRAMLKKQDRPLDSRYGDQPKWKYKLKVFAKSLLGRKPEDLYSLKRWIVLEQE